MPDVKISALPAATVPLAGTEVLPIVQSATTRQVSVANLTAGRAISASSVTNSALTSGRVTYAGTAGLLQDSANLLYSGTDLTVYGLTVGRGAGAVASNTALGASALAVNQAGGTNNTAIGNAALDANTTGDGNTAVGDSALGANTTASNNTAVGYEAGYTQTTALYNTYLGYRTGYLNTGNAVTAVGFNALAANTSAGDITAVGNAALQANTTGAENSAFGSGSLQSNTTGANNTALGRSALINNTTASNNTAVGYQAGYADTTGTNNLFVGQSAGSNLTTGSGCVFLGNGVQASAVGNNYEMVISGNTDSGKGGSTGFINTNGGGVYQGNNSATWSITSDARLKKNIVDNNTGLDKITAIQVRNFEYRLPEEVTDLPQNQAIKKEGVQLGAIAQELQQVLPDCVKTESTGVMSVNADPLTWYMINAIKELKAEFDAYKATHP